MTEFDPEVHGDAGTTARVHDDVILHVASRRPIADENTGKLTSLHLL